MNQYIVDTGSYWVKHGFQFQDSPEKIENFIGRKIFRADHNDLYEEIVGGLQYDKVEYYFEKAQFSGVFRSQDDFKKIIKKVIEKDDIELVVPKILNIPFTEMIDYTQIYLEEMGLPSVAYPN